MERRLAAALAFLLLTCSAAAAFADDARAEKFAYEVRWGEAKVADLQLQVGCPRASYQPAMLAAKSLGVADQIHAFRVRFDSFVDRSGHSLEGRTYIREEGVPRSFKSRFQTDDTVDVTSHFEKTTREETFRLPDRGHDLLSWMLALRHHELAPGKTYSYYVWDGWKLSRIEATVGKVGRVWTPLKVFRAFPISLVRTRLRFRGPRLFTPKADPDELGTLWLGTGERHVPVAMTYDAPIGTARVVLSRATTKSCSTQR